MSFMHLMVLPPNPNKTDPAGTTPYEELFIYYLKGHPQVDAASLGPDFIGTWIDDGYAFLFFGRPARPVVEQILAYEPALQFIDEYQMGYDEWQGGRLNELEIGPFLITMPWAEQNPPTDSDPSGHLRIRLDPGVVFGNGMHPTSADSLRALDFIFRQAQIETALDLGTGTGLLALAAARLGCRRVLAVDNNLLAVRTAYQNVCRNRLQGTILTVQGAAENVIDFASDLVISNIHYGVMKYLLISEGFRRKQWFVLSGLMRSQARDCLAVLGRYPIKILKEWKRDGIWYTCCGKAA